MRSFSLFYTVLCVVIDVSSAVRGDRRRVQVVPLPNNGKEAKCLPFPVADGKNSDSPSVSPSGSPSLSPSKVLLPKTGAPAVQLPYCPEAPTPLPKALKAAKADCLALAKGILPENPENSIDGYLKVDLSYDEDPAKALARVSEVLKQKTSATVAGCHEPPHPVLNETIVTNVTTPESGTNDTTPTILGVNFSDVSIGNACTPVNKTLNCSEVTCNVTIFYTGEANATEEAAMFDLLKAAIESQAAHGSFGSVVQISAVETGYETTTMRSGQTKAHSCTILAGVAGAVAFVGAMLTG